MMATLSGRSVVPGSLMTAPILALVRMACSASLTTPATGAYTHGIPRPFEHGRPPHEKRGDEARRQYSDDHRRPRQGVRTVRLGEDDHHRLDGGQCPGAGQGREDRPQHLQKEIGQGATRMTIARHNAGPRMSGAVVHNNTVYLAGQVAADCSAGVKGQTEQVLKKIDDLLKAAGTDKSKLLSATVYLADIRGFEEMNAVWDAWVVAGSTPGRATVEARLANPKLLVEIVAIAAV